MILSAQSIRARKLISPFQERGVAHGKSYGLSCAGYDIRIAETIWLWPSWGRLASSVEHFNMPDDLIAQVCDKSSWARQFVFVQNTIIEPGWKGFLTLELTRCLPWPVKIEAGTPIAQIIFFKLDQLTEHSYRGKYQNQERGPQPARHEVAG